MKANTYLLKLNDVLNLCQLSKSTLYRMIRAGDFPEPVALNKRAVAWKTDEIEAWIENLPRASERESAQA